MRLQNGKADHRPAFLNQQTAKMADAELLFLLVSVLAQAFLTLVRRHLMSLSFFTAWHN